MSRDWRLAREALAGAAAPGGGRGGLREGRRRGGFGGGICGIRRRRGGQAGLGLRDLGLVDLARCVEQQRNVHVPSLAVFTVPQVAVVDAVVDAEVPLDARRGQLLHGGVARRSQRRDGEDFLLLLG